MYVSFCNEHLLTFALLFICFTSCRLRVLSHLVVVTSTPTPCACDATASHITSKRPPAHHAATHQLACASITGQRRPFVVALPVLAVCDTSSTSHADSSMVSVRTSSQPQRRTLPPRRLPHRKQTCIEQR